MAKKKQPSIPGETDSGESSGPNPPPNLTATREMKVLNLSAGQCQAILAYAELPAHLSERLAAKGGESTAPSFTLDELDELLDCVEGSVYRAKGNERQKMLRIVEKVSKVLGAIIDPNQMPGRQPGAKTDAVFQIKMSLNGIDPPIWRRIQTKDCLLTELHDLIQVTMGWEFDHLYRFDIGGVEYADLEMMNDGEVEDAGDARLSEVLPPENRRPRFEYEYDFGDGWIHQLIVEERFPPEQGMKYPVCIAGQRACPPEDCGGPWSYMDLVEVMSDPEARKDDERMEWLGDFDPEQFDVKAVNKKWRRIRTNKP